MPIQLDSDSSRVVISEKLALDAATTFRCWIEPSLLVRWWPQTAQVQAQLGGRYSLAWPAMGWHLRGEFTELEPPHKLAFTWAWDHRPELPERLVEVQFEVEGVGTLLIVTHRQYSNSLLDQEDRQHHIDGWMHLLAQLKRLTNEMLEE